MEISVVMALLGNDEKITWKYLMDPYFAGPKWRYFCYMALKGPALYVYLWAVDQNNTYKGRRWRDRC